MLGGFCVRVTTGTTVSIVHWNEATALALPAASTARTKNVCRPSANGPNEAPLAHAANAAASTRHSKPDAPAEPNVNVVDGVETTAACAPIDGTAGATVSIVHWTEAAALAFPAASTARTKNVCRPSANGPNEAPLTLHTNPARPTRDLKPDAPAELNVNVVDAVETTAACAPIDGTAGATVSIVHWTEAAALAFPAASTARTKNVCRPSANGPNEAPLAHAANAAASTRHSKPDAPAEPNVNVVDGVETTAACAPIDGTAGATVSIVHWTEAAALAFPAASTARTKNVCRPSANGPNEAPLTHATNAAASTRHWKPDAPAELNVNVVDAVETTAACAAIDGTAGAPVSIVHWTEAAALAFPAASTARTKNVCRPSANGPNEAPLTHATNAAASTRHWKPDAPAELNVNVA